jgi:hypothetical protein
VRQSPTIGGAPSTDGIEQAAAMIQAVRAAVQQTAPASVSAAAPALTPTPPASETPRPPASEATRSATPPKAKGFYELEAVALTELLQRNYRLNVRVEGKGYVKAPRFIAYRVTQTGALQFAKLTKAEGDLAREINDIHRNYRFGDTQIIFTDSQPIWLQISNPKPYPLMWTDRHQFGKLKPLQALLGVYYDGAVAKPLIADMRGKNTSFTNGGWFGQPGAGKSTDMHEALCSMIEVTSPTELMVWGIDLSKNVFANYAGLPHIAQHTKNVETALEILQMFANWCEAGNLAPDAIHRLLVIDECQDLLTHPKYGKAALELLDAILSKGREFGIRVWMATQNPDAKCYPSTLKPKTHFMACCCIMNDAYVRSELGIYGASKITEKEELIFTGPRLSNQRVSIFYFTEQDRDDMIAGLIHKWGIPSFAVTPPAPPRNMVAPIAPAPPIESVAVAEQGRGGEVVTPAAALLLAGARDPAQHKWNLPHRALTPAEEDAIIQMVLDADPATEQFHYRGDPSINKIIVHVYAEKKNKEKITWVKGALIKGGLLETTDE